MEYQSYIFLDIIIVSMKLYEKLLLLTYNVVLHFSLAGLNVKLDWQFVAHRSLLKYYNILKYFLCCTVY